LGKGPGSSGLEITEGPVSDNPLRIPVKSIPYGCSWAKAKQPAHFIRGLGVRESLKNPCVFNNLRRKLMMIQDPSWPGPGHWEVRKKIRLT